MPNDVIVSFVNIVYTGKLGAIPNFFTQVSNCFISMKNGYDFNLPKLPVPKLDDTLCKYLKSVKPFVNGDEFARSQEIVKQFHRNEGPILQEYLERRSETCENWVSEWWDNMMYFDCRTPTTIYSSPGIIFPLQKFQNESERLNYAAKLILGAIDFSFLIDKNLIPPVKIGKNLIDMGQYKKIYGTCRIPRPNRDELEFNSNSRHIIVAKNNNFFKMEVITSDGQIGSFNKILNDLIYITQNSEIVGIPIGILTSDNRDNWFRAYSLLCKDEENLKIVDVIKQSLFLLCLDNALPKYYYKDDLSLAMDQCVHGGGLEGNSANRWFDKTLQFIVSSDGIVGITYEHSPCEAQPIAAITDHIIEYMQGNAWKCLPDVELKKEPELLHLRVGIELNKQIDIAALNLKRFIENLQFSIIHFKMFGKEFVISQNLSPDSFIQVAIQYAFYRIHNVPGPHYEAASTKKYIHGRTETIRSCSIESIAFAKTMLNDSSSNDDKIKYLRTAITAHKSLALDAMNGNGIDRHLFGLKMASRNLGKKLPELYKDSAFSRSSYMRLDTSQVAFKSDSVLAFKPLVPDGYGCCYNPHDKSILFALSDFLDNSETDLAKFKNALETSLIEMHDLLVKNIKFAEYTHFS